MGSSASKPLSSTSDFLQEIDSLVEELKQLAQSDVNPALFYTQLLQRAVFALNTREAAVWQIGSQGRFELIHQVGLTRFQSRRGSKLYARERDRLLPLANFFDVTVLPKQRQQNLDTWVVVAPIQLQEQMHSLLTVYLEEDMPLAVKQGFQRFVHELATIASAYEQSQITAKWQSESTAWKNYAELSLAVHGNWSVREVAYEIANEGRRYIGCDRVAVVLKKGWSCRLQAISGVDALHHHANVVRKMERLVQAVLPLQQPLFIEGSTEDLPPQIETRLQEYLDEGATRCLAIVPLFHATDKLSQDRQPPFGAVVFEQFEEESLRNLSERISLLYEQAELGLSRATLLQRVPFYGFLMQHTRLYAWLRVQAWPLWLTIFGVVASIVAMLVLVPAEFNLLTRGELEPVAKQHVFATQDGTVTRVLVENDQLVAKGELLVELSSTSLDLEFQRISGEMLVARKELGAIRAEQLQSRDYDSRSEIKLQELSAHELALQEQLNNLTKQLELLSRQREELQVKSPLEGRILTWDINDNLLARPVRRGDVLMTVADTEDDWIVRLLVPDTDMGHLLAAVAESKEALQISFVLASDPTTTHLGSIKHLGDVSQVDPLRRTNAVLVEVEFDPKSVPQLRAGASVVSKIHCGTRSLGYVWLREFLEEWDRHFF